MTFGEVYSEITKRSGLGFGQYTDRAQAAFWKAVGEILRSGDYRSDELRLAAKQSEAEAYLASEFPYDISSDTSISTDYVFTTDIELRPGHPALIHYTRLDAKVLYRGEYLRVLGSGGLKEVYYCLKYPKIHVSFNADDSTLASAWAYVTISWTGVPRTIVEGTTQNTSPAYNYFTQQLIDRAIEMAVKLMAQEA